MRKYFKRLTDDLVFFRIVMILWAIPLFSITVFALRDTSQNQDLGWLWVIPILAAALGVWLIVTAIQASDEKFERRLDVLGDGGDLVGLVFVLAVLVAAIPIYEITRFVRSTNAGASGD